MTIVDVYNYAPVNPFQQHNYEHISLAETKQTIGKARPVRGKAKDIYYFSNESLGLNIKY